MPNRFQPALRAALRNELHVLLDEAHTESKLQEMVDEILSNTDPKDLLSVSLTIDLGEGAVRLIRKLNEELTDGASEGVEAQAA